MLLLRFRCGSTIDKPDKFKMLLSNPSSKNFAALAVLSPIADIVTPIKNGLLE